MRKRHFFLSAVMALALGPVFAGALAAPKAKVVLTISGKIGESNSPQGAQFDMAMIEKLPQHSFTTLTPWEKKPLQFSGPPVRNLRGAVRAHGCLALVMASKD
jgi:hypothetical protein